LYSTVTALNEALTAEVRRLKIATAEQGGDSDLQEHGSAAAFYQPSDVPAAATTFTTWHASIAAAVISLPIQHASTATATATATAVLPATASTKWKYYPKARFKSIGWEEKDGYVDY
jgi:hypothetical protein